MATSFPTGLDSYTTKIDNTDDVLAAHINDPQDAIEALEAKVGVNSSAVSSSHDYKFTRLPTQVQNWDIGAYELRALKFYSDQATGTAPLIVLSTTIVSNLNADYLDGQHGSYYTNMSNAASGTLAVARGGTGVTSLASFFSSVYPVGSIYINATDSTNPGTLLGFGTWAAFGEGKVPVGYDSTDVDFNLAEKTGGAKTHYHICSTLKTGAINVWTSRGAATPAYGNSRRACDDVSGGIDSDLWRFNQVPVTGDTDSQSGVPPYITVYMWKRTA